MTAGESGGKIIRSLKIGKIKHLFSIVKFSKFTTVGIMGAVIDSSVLSLLVISMSFPLVSSKLIGAELAIISMFLLNEYWTFSEDGLNGKYQRLIRFMKIVGLEKKCFICEIICWEKFIMNILYSTLPRKMRQKDISIIFFPRIY